MNQRLQEKLRFTEEKANLMSIAKWFLLASMMGVLVGGATTFFLKTLHFTIDITHGLNWDFAGTGTSFWFVLLPVGLFISALLSRHLLGRHKDYTTDRVIKTIHKSESMSFVSILKSFFLPIITIATGGSAGKEAPAADMGAGIGSILSKFFSFDTDEKRKLMICGVSAGFASVFGTPVAGALFGVEVLFVGAMMYEVILPSFIAGITAYQVSSSLGIEYFEHTATILPDFSEKFFLWTIGAGIFFGICSIFLIELMKWGKRFSGTIKMWEPYKALIGGTVLVLITMGLGTTDYLGLGLGVVENTLEGEMYPWYSFLIKALFTVITLNFGGSGGIITTLIFIGSTAGSLYGDMFGLDVSTFAAIGMVSVLAGSANTPISASIMAIELFGSEIAPYAAVACIITFVMCGNRSVYPSQVLKMRKADTLSGVQMNQEMSMQFETEIKYSERRRLQRVSKVVKTLVPIKKTIRLLLKLLAYLTALVEEDNSTKGKKNK